MANTLAAVSAGAVHVQGTINGYGERTGNADLLTVVANLELKHGRSLLAGDGLREMTRIAHAISEITNIAPFARQPYVGASAFAHKAGLHASAIKVDPDMYQHADPQAVGNDMRMLVSDMAGRASIELKGRELGFDLTGRGELLSRVTNRVKDAEAQGYTYDAADASFELLLREELDGARPSFWTTESWRVFVETVPGDPNQANSEATVKMHVGGERVLATGEGNGPVNALDHALRKAVAPTYPEVERFELIDFKVRILDTEHGTDATTRVLVETMDTQAETTWMTVGVGPEPRRGVVGGPGRLAHLRPAACGGRLALLSPRGPADRPGAGEGSADRVRFGRSAGHLSRKGRKNCADSRLPPRWLPRRAWGTGRCAMEGTDRVPSRADGGDHAGADRAGDLGLLRALPDAVLVCAADGTIVEVNDEAERLFGYSGGRAGRLADRDARAQRARCGPPLAPRAVRRDRASPPDDHRTGHRGRAQGRLAGPGRGQPRLGAARGRAGDRRLGA